jgi:hypothetical protein
VVVVEPVETPSSDTHILLDYENVQPTEEELRAMVPEATRVWVFHGPHQKQVAQRFASFGTGMTTVPISKTGKNALDFHLSFYMGYIASRNQQAKFVVVANDKGYEPMLEHAKVLGFAVRQHGHARSAEPVAQKAVATAAPGPAAAPVAKKVAAKKAPAKKAAVKSVTKAPAAKKAVAKKAQAKKVVAKKAPPVAAKKGKKAGASAKAVKADPHSSGVQPGSAGAGSLVLLQKMIDSLRKMGDKRPGKQASLRRALKPLLGAAASDEAIEVALGNLIARSVVAIGASGAVSYPKFAESIEKVASDPVGGQARRRLPSIAP